MEPRMYCPWPPMFQNFAEKGMDRPTAIMRRGVDMTSVSANDWYPPKPVVNRATIPEPGDTLNRAIIDELMSSAMMIKKTVCRGL